MKIIVTGGSGFIGTAVVDYLIEIKVEILNLDIASPKKQTHFRYWKKQDLLDKDNLIKHFDNFQPTHVIHLAARTDIEGKTIEEYKVNTEGTANILKVIENTHSIKRVIITSTQFVNQYRGLPKHDEDFAPHTVYGKSKVVSEKLTRQVNLNCTWTIIRPTNIWGPWHLRYAREFWRILAKGIYIHPGKNSVTRSYGYVGNVVYQIMKIFEVPEEKVNGRIFYVGDMPIDLIDWVNAFAVKQTGKKVIVVPRFLVRGLSLIGDTLSCLNIGFPVTSSRYKSMTTSNEVPMKSTFELLGNPPYSLEDGIEATVKWLKETHSELVKIR